MTDIGEFNHDKIELLSYRMLTGKVDEPAEFVSESIVGHFQECALELSYNLEDNLVRSLIKLRIETVLSNQTDVKATGEFSFEFIFKVENLNQLTVKQDGVVTNISAVLGSHIGAISYSTLRGILLMKLQGTALSEFIMPITNPLKLVT